MEAFIEYLEHLDSGGLIALKLYDEVTLTRALSTGLAAFRHLGMNDQQALQHMLAIIDRRGIHRFRFCWLARRHSARKIPWS